MMLGMLTLVIVLLLTVIVRHHRRAGDLTDNAPMNHACGASNPPNARYCRRCGESLVLDLVLEPTPPDAAAHRR
jgi:hypothetical protein